MSPRLAAIALFAVVAGSACADPLLEGGPDDAAPSDTGAWEVSELPALLEPCALDPEGTNLVVTTTDFATGSVTFVDTRNREVHRDVALGSTDAIPFAAGHQAYLVHRFGHDFVEVLDPRGDAWRSMGQFAIERDDVRVPNPHSIALGPDGLAYVPLFGVGRVRAMDLTQPPGTAFSHDIDLSAFADADGNPEPSLAFSCGDTMFVSIQRLSPAFAVVGPDALVPIDLPTATALDVDPDRDGGQGIALRGTWLRQLRRDPADPEGHTVLGLTTGIERIDLAHGGVEWAVPPEAFAAAGAGHYLLPIAFDVDATGRRAFVASYGSSDPDHDCGSDPGPCFAQATLFEVPIDGVSPPTLMPFATGFDVSERTVEVVGSELWFGSRRIGASGLWFFDTSVSPPLELGGPLSTGLAPYSMTTLEGP